MLLCCLCLRCCLCLCCPVPLRSLLCRRSSAVVSLSWPLPGYYSTSETQYSPIPCLLPSACSGVDPTEGSAPGFVFDAAATCNRDAGFTGYLCSQCDSSHYAVEQTCRSCELDAAARRTLVATVIAAVCLFAMLALGVAFMSDAKLVFFVTAIVLIQQCSFVGAVAAVSHTHAHRQHAHTQSNTARSRDRRCRLIL